MRRFPRFIVDKRSGKFYYKEPKWNSYETIITYSNKDNSVVDRRAFPTMTNFKGFKNFLDKADFRLPNDMELLLFTEK